MADKFKALRDATANSVLDSPATTSPQLRRSVANGTPPADLAALVQKIQSRAYTVTDEDLDSLRSTYNDDQLFEIIVAAAIGAASQRLAAAHKALEEA